MNQLDVKRQQRENPRNSEKAGANASAFFMPCRGKIMERRASALREWAFTPSTAPVGAHNSFLQLTRPSLSYARVPSRLGIA